METTAQAVPGYYVWEIPGRAVAVHLHLDVVDRLLAEAMSGFGAVPKRGAEVGGILLGTIEPSGRQEDRAIVRVDDFAPVPCEYKLGPSYQFAGDDRSAFRDACERWQPGASAPAYAVGYFRSHTRDGLALAQEDSELLDRHFPSPSHIALLIKPYATKVSTAGIFFREGGAFQQVTPLEFPFRRREMTGEEAPPRRSLIERRPRVREMRPAPPPAAPENIAEPEYAVSSIPKPRRRWAWIPLSFVFLLLGVVLGFQLALSTGPRVTGAAGSQDFLLSLSVARSGDNLDVKWDREAPAVRAAQRGLLEIEDGGDTKSLDLDAAQLKNGGIVYRSSSDAVRFRLVVYPADGVSVTEIREWKQ